MLKPLIRLRAFKRHEALLLFDIGKHRSLSTGKSMLCLQALKNPNTRVPLLAWEELVFL
ncbi:hypothetical protein D3C79_1122580 [compost metagenome]